MPLKVTHVLTAAARALVIALDTLLRRLAGISEFSDHPHCLLRLGLSRSHTEILLSDGTHIRRGDPVGQLHLWNEHIPPMSAHGPDVHWAVQFYRGVLNSLKSLSAYIQTDDGFIPVRTFWAEIGIFQREDVPAAARVLGRLGFDIQYLPAPISWWDRVLLFWKNLYTWCLMWTFQPTSLRGRSPGRVARFRVWISCAELLARYGEGAWRW